MSDRQKQQAVDQLEAILEDMKTIHEFHGDTFYNINRLLSEINTRIDANAKKVGTYHEYRADKSVSQVKRINLGLDIASENFAVINKRQELMDIYFNDIYQRIERLGNAISDQSHLLKTLVLNEQDD